MDRVFDNIAKRFIGFFTRSVVPSSIFFVLLFFNDSAFHSSKIYNQFMSRIGELQTIDSILVYMALTVLFLSYGYLNQMLSQIMDNFIRNNYDRRDKEFCELRDKVKIQCNQNETVKQIFTVIDFNDYNAYQVLGKNIEVGYAYADEVKSIHTFCIALILNLVIEPSEQTSR